MIHHVRLERCLGRWFDPLYTHDTVSDLLPAATKLGQGNIFTSVCLSTEGGGVSASVHAGMPPRPGPGTPLGAEPPGADTPQTRHPPEQTPPGPGTPRRSRSPPESRLQHMVNERPVRILLECILVRNWCPQRVDSFLRLNATTIVTKYKQIQLSFIKSSLWLFSCNKGKWIVQNMFQLQQIWNHLYIIEAIVSEITEFSQRKLIL